MDNQQIEMTMLEHLEELRKRIWIVLFCFCGSFIFTYAQVSKIITLLKVPLGNVQLVFITPMEGFLTKLSVAGLGALVIAMPVILWQILAFIAPGLYKKEKKALLIWLPFMSILFAGGVYFCYRFILPTTLQFFMSFGSEQMQPMLSAQKYFTFVSMLILIIGLIFELPLLLLLLHILGIVKYEMLVRKRKYALLMIVIITAVLTPTPDAFTLLAVSIPMALLFEVGLGLMYFYQRMVGRKKDESI